MFAVFQILIDTEASKGFVGQFLEQPIDVVLLEILLVAGPLPILGVLVWGFLTVWQSYRQDVYAASLPWVLLAIDVPKMTEQSPKAMENLFASMQGAYSTLTWKETWVLGKFQPRFTFEIVSIDGYIQYFVRTEKRYRDTIEAGIYAQYPDAQIAEAEDWTGVMPTDYPNEEWEMWGSELTLAKEDYFPIRTWVKFEHSMSQELKDPLGVILEQLGRMKPGEVFVLQIVTQVIKQDWQKEGTKFIRKIYGLKDEKKKSLLDSAVGASLVLPSGVLEQTVGVDLLGMLGMGAGPEEKPDDIWKAFKITLEEKAMVEGVNEKCSKNGMQFKIRLCYFGRHEVYDKRARTAMVKGMMNQFAYLNKFGLYGPQTPKDDYFWQIWTYPKRQTRLTSALKKRSFSIGAPRRILNTEELSSIWHFPTITIKAPLVKKTESRRAEPPVGLPVAIEDTSPSRPSRGSTPSSVPIPSLEGSASATQVGAAPVSKVEIALPKMDVERPAPTPSRKAPPPTAIPLAPQVEFHPPVAPASVPSSKAVKPKIPDAMRVLLEPGVELEDVRLPPSEETPEDKTDDAPSNLPL